MKKTMLLLIATLLSLIPLTALADVIFEPNDSFYVTHRDNCVYVGRSYLTNGADGAAVLWDDPESGVSQYAVRNGVSFYISHTYSGNGAVWGVVEYAEGADGSLTNSYGGSGYVGWVRMDEMLLEHDSKAFIEMHEAELTPYTGGYEAVLQAGENTVLWSYPGSGVTAGTLYEPGALTFEHAYTDEEGRLWGYITYHYGIRDVWVCVSDPANAGIKALSGPAIELHPANSDSVVMKALGNKQAARIRLGGGALGTSGIMVIALVVAVVAVTAVLIAALMKKRRR